MGLLYKEEHTTCYNYQLQFSADFKVIQLVQSNIPKFIEVEKTVILFLLRGEILITCNNFKEKLLQEQEMALLPKNSSCHIKVLKDSSVICCSFVQGIDFCNRFSFHQLINFVSEKYTYDFLRLPIQERLLEYLFLLKHCLEDKLSCMHYHEIKEKELFILLRAYYSKEELAQFFFPLIGKDIDFKDFVLTNYQTVASLSEFSQLANLSLDTFKRRFKDTFGESAHKWITQRKAEFIYRDIVTTDESFVEISAKYKLSSQAYLSTFCKQHFNKSPQELRDSSRID